MPSVGHQRHARPLAAFVAVAVLGCGGGRESSPVGSELYFRRCASCHGVAGRGDGPAGEALTPRPADLTRLDLDLPALKRTIEGREARRAHGTSAMPVWGEVFAEELVQEPKARAITALRLQALAEHVRSLRQAPP
jgi:mono/diheme cytochrome c family protein